MIPAPVEQLLWRAYRGHIPVKADTARQALPNVWTVDGNKIRCLVSAYGKVLGFTCAAKDAPVIGFNANHGVERMDGWLPAGATGSIAGRSVRGVFKLKLSAGDHVLRWVLGGHVHTLTISGPPAT